jgi:hypothetical protein
MTARPSSPQSSPQTTPSDAKAKAAKRLAAALRENLKRRKEVARARAHIHEQGQQEHQERQERQEQSSGHHSGLKREHEHIKNHEQDVGRDRTSLHPSGRAHRSGGLNAAPSRSEDV